MAALWNLPCSSNRDLAMPSNSAPDFSATFLLAWLSTPAYDFKAVDVGVFSCPTHYFFDCCCGITLAVCAGTNPVPNIGKLIVGTNAIDANIAR